MIRIEQNFKNLKGSILISALLCIGLGVVLILYPQITMSAICYAFGGLLIVSALFHIFIYYKHKNQNSFVNINLIIAIISGVIGILIVSKPSIVILIIPIIFGIILILHAMIDVRHAILLKDNYYNNWWWALIIAGINIGFAVVLFINPFQASKTLIVILGVSQVYDGLSDIWIFSRLNKAIMDIKKSINAINDNQ